MDELHRPGEETRTLAQELTSLHNAVALKGLIDDERWKQFIIPVLEDVKSRAARRRDLVENTMDGAFESAFLRGVKKGLEAFEAKLQKLYTLASREIEDARQNRPV